MKTSKLEELILAEMERSDFDVFLRSDFAHLGNYQQIGKALSKLQSESKLLRIGRGIYCLARISRFSPGKIVPKGDGLPGLARQALTRLGYEVVISKAERDSIKYMQVKYMQNHNDQEFLGVTEICEAGRKPRNGWQTSCAWPARLSGTGRWGCSSSQRLKVAPGPSRARLPTARRSPLPVAATHWLLLPNTASKTRSVISPLGAAHSSKCSKAKPCPRSRSWRAASTADCLRSVVTGQ